MTPSKNLQEILDGITFIGYAQNRKIGKPNNLTFCTNKTKGRTQYSINRLRSPMPEGGEP
jgi:hypothetical protein